MCKTSILPSFCSFCSFPIQTFQPIISLHCYMTYIFLILLVYIGPFVSRGLYLFGIRQPSKENIRNNWFEDLRKTGKGLKCNYISDLFKWIQKCYVWKHHPIKSDICCVSVLAALLICTGCPVNLTLQRKCHPARLISLSHLLWYSN